jgi:hypothetical protein
MAADGKGGADGADGSTGGGLEAIAKVLGLGADATLTDLLSKIGELKTAMGGDDDDDDDGDADADAAAMAAPPPGSTLPPKPGDKKAAAAASRELLRLTGQRTYSEALSHAGTWKASHLQIEADRKKLDMDRAALAAADRRDLERRLVTECGEDPASVADLADMPLERLRSRVERLSKNPKKEPYAKPPGGGASSGFESLSPRELELCKSKGIDPAAYAAKFKKAVGQPSLYQSHFIEMVIK